MVFDRQTWDAWQKAAASGHIRYLYKLTIEGRISDTVIGYCTGSDTVTYDDVLYIPYPCKHEDIEKTLDDAETKITLAANELWLSVLFMNNPRALHLEIIRYRSELADGETLYRGSMRQRDLSTNIITIEFGSAFAAENTNMITYYTQRYCNHSQYGKYCGLSFDAFKYVVPAGGWSVVGRKEVHLTPEHTLNVESSYWAELILIYPVRIEDSGYSFTYEQDNIAAAVGPNIIKMKYAMSRGADLTAGITIAPNCLLQLTRCKNLFGNLPAACGWPDMPLRNYAALDAAQLGSGEGGPMGIPGKSPQRQ